MLIVFLVVEYVSLAAFRTIQEVEGLAGEDNTQLTQSNTIKQILRSLGYMCANLAFIVNINRWLHIINFKQGEESEQLDRQIQGRRITIVTWVSVFIDIAVCLIYGLLQIFVFSDTVDVTFLFIQSCIWNPAIAIGYLYISRIIRSDHKKILENFQMSLEEQDLLDKANRNTQRYFFYIQQYLLFFSLYLISFIPIDILNEMGQQPSVTLVRVKDCMNMVFSISKILMLYGFSSLFKSAKQQLSRQQSMESNRKESLLFDNNGHIARDRYNDTSVETDDEARVHNLESYVSSSYYSTPQQSSYNLDPARKTTYS